MPKDVTVDTKQLHRDIKKAQRRIDQVAQRAMAKVIAGKKQTYMSFDDVEAVPYASQASGTLVFSGSFEIGDTSLEELLARESQDVIEATVEELNKGIKGVFK